MRKAIIAATLLVLGSAVLGATVLREPFAAAATPFENVIIGNDNSHPVPVTGTFGISTTNNTVNLGTADHTDLDSANTHLANIDSQTGKLKFDGDGNLQTTGSLPPAATGSCWDRFDIEAGHSAFFSCNMTTASTVLVGGADDSVSIAIMNSGSTVLELFGGGNDGNDQWQVPLTRPLPVNGIRVQCDNFVEDCKLFVEVTGS